MSDENRNNLFANLPTNLPEELITVLVQNRQLRIERIVSTGQSSPQDFWYDQAESEWVVLLQGAATLQYQLSGESVRLSVGDCVFIPAHQRHRVEWTTSDEPTVWLAVFFSPE